ncbi:MAG: LapA family protein [Erythrobacter sp.]
MQVIRTIAWVLLVCGILIFSVYNWRPVEVTIWENLVLETKVPVLMVLAFLGGLVPVLAYHLSVKWALKRRIRTLENSLKTLATARSSDAAEPAAQPKPAPIPEPDAPSADDAGLPTPAPEPAPANLGPSDTETVTQNESENESTRP